MAAKRRIVLLGGGFSWAPGSPPTLHRVEPGSGGAVRETGLPAGLLT
ncbi:hypothetical protein ABZ312_29285 [Streptomyces sp. NPDC006207]